MRPLGAAEPSCQTHTKLRKEMPGVGEAVVVLEKLLYGLIIFLVSSCLERVTHLSFRDGPFSGLPR